MSGLGYAYVPIIFTIVFTLQIFTTYTLALVNGDIDPFLPYLSSAADRRPQSCIFGIFTNICAGLSFFIIYLRHRYCASVHTNTTYLLPRAALNVSKFIGYTAAIAMFIVANVQETAITSVHLTAAFVTFLFGTLYMLLQSFVSFTMVGHLIDRSLARLRFAISLLSLIAFLGSIIFAWLASHEFHATYPDLPIPRPWSKKTYQPGTGYHNISALFEWAAAFIQCIYFVTFSAEFEDIELELHVYHKNAVQLKELLRSEREQNPYGW